MLLRTTAAAWRPAAQRCWASSAASSGEVLAAAGLGYPSRTHIMQKIDYDHDIFSAARCVVDVGCAPGEWLQVASQHMGINPHEMNPRHQRFLYGIDKRRMAPIPGATVLTGDFTKVHGGQDDLLRAMDTAGASLQASLLDNETTTRYYMSVYASENTQMRTGEMDIFTLGRNGESVKRYEALEERYRMTGVQMRTAFVDGVMADLSPQFVPQSSDEDNAREQVQLANTAKTFALKMLREGGWFVCLVRNGPEAFAMVQALSLYFQEPHILKPNPDESVLIAKKFIGRSRVGSHHYAGLEREAVNALPETGPRQLMKDMLGYTKGRRAPRLSLEEMAGGARFPKPKRLSHSQRRRAQLLGRDGGAPTGISNLDRVALLGSSVPNTR